MARKVDSKTMSLQHLEALKALGATPAAKILIPVELTEMLRPFMKHADRAVEAGGRGSTHSLRR